MSHSKIPSVNISILFAALILGIVVSVLSFYCYKPCPNQACTKHATTVVIKSANQFS